MRPRPLCTSSAMNSAPVLAHASVIAAANAGVSGRTPPSPCTGSAMIAAVVRRHRRRERRGVVRPARTCTAGSSGSNGVAVVLVRGDRQRAERAAVKRLVERDELRRAARPSCTSSGARTSGTPRPPRCRCCRRTRAAAPTGSPAARRAAPAAGERTGSTCGSASAPARRSRARGRGCAWPSDATPMPDSRSRYSRPSASNRRTPWPRTNVTGWRR